VRSARRENRRDLVSVAFALVWQVSLFLTMVHLVLHKFDVMAVLLAALAVSTAFLYFFWYRPMAEADRAAKS
jgi:hypothetical protein